MIKVLIISNEDAFKTAVKSMVRKEFDASVSVEFISHPTFQDSVEFLETTEHPANLIICKYPGKNVSILKTLLEQSTTIPVILIQTGNKGTKQNSDPDLMFRTIPFEKIQSELPIVLKEFSDKQLLKTAKNPDFSFIKISAETIEATSPINTDIYIRLAEDRYIKIFKASDQLTYKELQAALFEKQTSHFYVLKSDSSHISKRIETLLDDLVADAEAQPEKVKAIAVAATDHIREIISVAGFNPEAELIAKKTAFLVVKMLGARPHLASILQGLRKHEGQYIASHSLTLSEISCALACQIGWNSAPTYLKLSLAALLHDITIPENELAKLHSLKSEAALDLSQVDLNIVKMHTIKASDYVKKLHDIPPDVDNIILHHHERPNGTGFPRGLHHQYIQPLPSLFIMAHDVLDYFIENGKSGTLEAFLAQNKDIYQVGNFKKIYAALEASMKKKPASP